MHVLDTVRTQWRLWARQCGFDDTISEHWLADLIVRYQEPQRHYHGLTHIVDLLKKLEAHADGFKSYEETVAALFFHDAIYDIPGSENEAQSAVLAGHALEELGFSPDSIGRVKSTILATANHAKTDDHDINLFVDLDMSILGAPQDVYKTYAERIMAEYLPVYDRQMYTNGRMELFLKPTLAADRMFLTERFRPLDEQARSNLQWEIGWLREDAAA